jgi:hypothetical protein
MKTKFLTTLGLLVLAIFSRSTAPSSVIEPFLGRLRLTRKYRVSVQKR